MTCRDPLSIQVEPPKVFDRRRWRHWTVDELMSHLILLADRVEDSEGEEREESLRKESNVMQCLGWMAIRMVPPVELMEEWKQALADEKAATRFSTEWFEALDRQAEIQRACGAELMDYDRDYRRGAEPTP